MEDNLKILHEKTDEFIGTLVLDHFDVCLFLGIEVNPDDYYYKLSRFGDIRYSSCVGRITPLKGFINDKDYDYYVNVWNLNNDEKAK